ncbi:MAG: hypothetical protein ACFCUW_08960 [Kiloniellaceae bacterium]
MSGGELGKGSFTIVLCSDIDYEYLFAAIEYNGQEIAIVTQEEGKQAMKIEATFGDPVKPGIAWAVELDGFLEAVERAKRRLMER